MTSRTPFSQSGTDSVLSGVFWQFAKKANHHFYTAFRTYGAAVYPGSGVNLIRTEPRQLRGIQSARCNGSEPLLIHPGGVTRLIKRLEILAIPKCIHALPEPTVTVGAQTPLVCQAGQWFGFEHHVG